jgi:hypothetical protein
MRNERSSTLSARTLPSRAKPSPSGSPPENSRGLLHERELLRSSGAKRALERNRLEIVRVQWELTHALVERYA